MRRSLVVGVLGLATGAAGFTAARPPLTQP